MGLNPISTGLRENNILKTAYKNSQGVKLVPEPYSVPQTTLLAQQYPYPMQ
jgi:hypothetical protein